jgi:hypothetical protein
MQCVLENYIQNNKVARLLKKVLLCYERNNSFFTWISLK